MVFRGTIEDCFALRDRGPALMPIEIAGTRKAGRRGTTKDRDAHIFGVGCNIPDGQIMTSRDCPAGGYCTSYGSILIGLMDARPNHGGLVQEVRSSDV